MLLYYFNIGSLFIKEVDQIQSVSHLVGAEKSRYDQPTFPPDNLRWSACYATFPRTPLYELLVVSIYRSDTLQLYSLISIAH